MFIFKQSGLNGRFIVNTMGKERKKWWKKIDGYPPALQAMPLPSSRLILAFFRFFLNKILDEFFGACGMAL